MEAVKKNWPLFTCTAAIIVTMALCTHSLSRDTRLLKRMATDLPTLVMYAQRMDRRTMTSQERGEIAQRCAPVLMGEKLFYPCGSYAVPAH